MAEAPSFRISRESIAAVGIEFRSNTDWKPLNPADGKGAARRPLMSTSVLLAPRPRRLNELTPGVKLVPPSIETRDWPEIAGMARIASPKVENPVALNSASVRR